MHSVCAAVVCDQNGRMQKNLGEHQCGFCFVVKCEVGEIREQICAFYLFSVRRETLKWFISHRCAAMQIDQSDPFSQDSALTPGWFDPLWWTSANITPALASSEQTLPCCRLLWLGIHKTDLRARRRTISEIKSQVGSVVSWWMPRNTWSLSLDRLQERFERHLPVCFGSTNGFPCLFHFERSTKYIFSTKSSCMVK